MNTASEAPDTVLHERHGAVLTITLNRPAQKNAVDHEVAVRLASALDLLDADPGLSVGVLTGSGGVFSAGMDLKAFAKGELPLLPGRGLGGLTRAVVRKPLIAAVEGWALGGGFEMVLACDLIVAAQDARFGFPEVTRGLVAAEGGLVRLPRRLPYHVAARVLLTGEPLTAAEGKEYGLVDELTPPGAALDAARELAERVARSAPLALAAVKEVLRETQGLNESDAFTRQDELTSGLFSSEDAQEGAQAFAEKRTPVWHGR
ncbi:crotonase/enoyl-CoA hydratase family protein [Streptomyces sp. NPDC056663]|uniref:crotonase/enoyl-CoA hydratase family protein n=1 Tax=Streptomyces sp. NPDC056663 TaxID=3345899 RepID=UPI003678020A